MNSTIPWFGTIANANLSGFAPINSEQASCNWLKYESSFHPMHYTSGQGSRRHVCSCHSVSFFFLTQSSKIILLSFPVIKRYGLSRHCVSCCTFPCLWPSARHTLLLDRLNDLATLSVERQLARRCTLRTSQMTFHKKVCVQHNHTRNLYIIIIIFFPMHFGRTSSARWKNVFREHFPRTT